MDSSLFGEKAAQAAVNLLIERGLVQKQHSKDAWRILTDLENSGLDSKALVSHIADGRLSFDRWQVHQKIRGKKDLHPILKKLERIVLLGHQESFRRATYLAGGEGRTKYSRVREAAMERVKELVSGLPESSPPYLSPHFSWLKNCLRSERVLHSFYFGLGLTPAEVFEGGLTDPSRVENRILEEKGRFDKRAFKRALIKVNDERDIPSWLAREARVKIRKL
ncbi:MAG TPA: hypothetical protein VJI71_01740 [Candidatus Norongarragalinales archaeon]|nr:hypothetical protein [Candidatus Norongarragalinales archaeon]